MSGNPCESKPYSFTSSPSTINKVYKRKKASQQQDAFENFLKRCRAVPALYQHGVAYLEEDYPFDSDYAENLLFTA